ncbi:S1C family serine protease [Streptomyces sp. HPF1205]|uniref:S1C family serine protease n=1 Tax=Streptomyces sp. HPF1205 TaxID=2873262 RepID=UPI0035ABECCC
MPATPAYASAGAYGGTSAPQSEGGGGGGGGGPVWGAPVPSGDGSGSGTGPGGFGFGSGPGSGSGSGSGGRRRGVGALVAAVVVAALVAGGVGGGIGYEVAKHNNDNSGSTTISAPSSIKALDRAPNSVAGIANRALPSVVTIKASGSQESGTGTGFVYDTQGHILTNNHVVAPAANGGKLTVTFSNGNTYDAEVVGRAQGYDVAVVKLKSASGVKLTPLPLGNSDDARVGDATIAIGAPFGLSGTVTTGIVSAVHRPVASSDGQGSSPASYMSAIQTDASINPGNSGGPLMNANGAVIGINSAIQPAGNTSPGSQGGSVGLGFAIPINQAKRVADQLIKTGQPVYPVMKVSLDTAYDGDGARIGPSADDVTPGGPGAQAGLKPGDVITKFDGTIIDSGQTLIGEIWTHSPGDKVTVTYTRDGSTHTTTVTLGSRVGDSTN